MNPPLPRRYLTIALLLLVTRTAQGQAVGGMGENTLVGARVITAGTRLGYDIDAAGRDIARNLVGVELTYHLSRRWGVGPSIDYYVNLPGAFRFNFDSRYRLPILWNVTYLGGGLALPNDDGPHNYAGINAFLGFTGGFSKSLTPFAEARWVFFPNYTSFTIVTGAHVAL